jgi:hypothetical protein
MIIRSRAIPSKVTQRSSGPCLSRGTAVVMNDGWRGKVEQDDGDTVVCIRDGERPNDWLRGYRAFGRRLMTINGSKAVVDWKSAATASRPIVDRERHHRGGVVVDLARLRAEREWKSAPD